MTPEPRRNNLRVVNTHLNDGRTTTSVTLAKLLVQEIEELRAELIEARLEVEAAWDAHDDVTQPSADIWDEGFFAGWHQVSQDVNPYRKESDDRAA